MVTVPSLVDETPLDQYTATASQTDFNFTYMIFATEDIKVYVNDVLKTETTDYVVKQSDGSAIVPADDLPMDGGKVVFNSGLTSGDKVSLSRDIAIERLTGYSVAGAFRADVVNAEFTKLYAVQQQLERDISRSVRLSDYDAEGGTFTLPENRASKFLAFDASGNMIASAGSIGATPIVVSSFMETVLDDTTAAAALTTLGISSYAQTLLDDADAAAARTTLAAQQDVITTRGDIIRGSSGAVAERLALGSSEQVLKSDGTDLVWGSYQDATQTIKGIVEQATNAEVAAGSDSERYITPAGLLSLFTSSTIASGLFSVPIKDSTDSEFNEFRVYAKLQSTTIPAGGASTSITFGSAFPNACLGVWITPQAWSGSNPGLVSCFVTSVSTTGFNASNPDGDTNITAFYYCAVGY